MFDAESNCEEARTHPVIAAFAKLVKDTVGDGVLDFEHLKTPPFMSYWAHLAIHRFEDEIGDFRAIMWGSHIVQMFGKDCTGMTLPEIGYGPREETVRQINLMVMNERKTIYKSGDFYWQDQEFKKWVQIKMPLMRNGEVREVLFCQDFIK